MHIHLLYMLFQFGIFTAAISIFIIEGEGNKQRLMVTERKKKIGKEHPETK